MAANSVASLIWRPARQNCRSPATPTSPRQPKPWSLRRGVTVYVLPTSTGSCCFGSMTNSSRSTLPRRIRTSIIPNRFSSRPVPGTDQSTDLSPVGIAVDGGASVDVSHLVIRRDVYYISRDDNGYAPSQMHSSIDLQPDEFFMLGDNSPRSSDGRYWPNQHYVNRRLLIGKALFIYWPHSFNYVEVVDKKVPFPYWPNFSRMRFVH